MTSVLNLSPEALVNTYTNGGQDVYASATLTDGSYVLVWTSGQDGSGYGIYYQRFDAQGQKLGLEGRANTYTTSDQDRPTIAATGDGGFVIVWDSFGQDGANQGIYGQRYAANGTASGTEFRVSTQTALSQLQPCVTGLLGGGFVVTWGSDGQDGSGYGTYAQRYSAGGVAAGIEFRINTSIIDDQKYSTVAALANGGFVVTWSDADSSDVYMQRYDVSGAAAGGETLVNTTPSGILSHVAAFADGGFVVAWAADIQDGNLRDVYFRRFDANGNPVGSGTLANATRTSYETVTDVTALSDGGFVITWYGADSDTYGTWLQRFDSEGQAVGSEILINTYMANDQTNATVTALADGGFAVAWSSYGEDGSGYGVYQRVFTAADSLAGNQMLYGTGDADDLDGGSGADKMYGGFGDDTYHVNSLGDLVYELTDQGIDTVMSSVSYTSLDVNIENLVLTGLSAINGNGNANDNILIGNDAANHMLGGGGYDDIHGGGGADTLDGGPDNDTISGDAGDDYITGGDGFDTLDGGAGSDFITGGNDDDTVDGGAANDTLVGGNGNDNMLGGDGNDELYGQSDVDALDGGSGQDYVDGGSGGDVVTGGSGNDSVYGGTGDDIIDGGTGNDTLDGGDGNDLATAGEGVDVIYLSTGADRLSGGLDEDTLSAVNISQAVTINLNNARASFSAGPGLRSTLDGIEDIIGSDYGDTLTGGAGDNVIDGASGADKMAGSLGNDTYYVDDALDTVTESSNATSGGADEVFSVISFTLGSYVEVLTLTGLGNIDGTGNNLDNVITGNAGNNLIDAKAGSDVMIGGLGDDTYWVDVAGDVVIEQVGEGTDTVRAGLSYTLGSNVENLLLTGTGDFSGTGNSAVNAITGNSGKNTLDGGTGADMLAGGTGGDTYYVDNAGDNVVEADSADVDIIFSSVTYSLSGRFVEVLNLTGAGNINATGNSKANTLVSNAGNNSLTGGGGADIFVFQTGSKADTITDFNSTQGDSINAAAYSAVSHTIVQSGTNVVIDFGGGNTITVLNGTVADVTAHTLFS